MTHNEKRIEWYKESFLNLIGGSVYGAASIICGHPLDTVKTKMQAQGEYLHDISMRGTIRDIWTKAGVRGFYKGAVPPFFGAMFTRSTQFSVVEGIYTFFDKNRIMTKPIWFFFDSQPSMLFAGFCAGLMRTVIECPFEYMKVRAQTGLSRHFRDLYKGFFSMAVRNSVLLATFFNLIDIVRRNTSLYESMPGQFLMGGLAATYAWILIWPFENLKNRIQADTDGKHAPWVEHFKMMYENGGLRGLYRGLLPGAMCVFFRNGCAFLAISLLNKSVIPKVRERIK